MAVPTLFHIAVVPAGAPGIIGSLRETGDAVLFMGRGGAPPAKMQQRQPPLYGSCLCKGLVAQMFQQVGGAVQPIPFDLFDPALVTGAGDGRVDGKAAQHIQPIGGSHIL